MLKKHFKSVDTMTITRLTRETAIHLLLSLSHQYFRFKHLTPVHTHTYIQEERSFLHSSYISHFLFKKKDNIQLLYTYKK